MNLSVLLARIVNVIGIPTAGMIKTTLTDDGWHHRRSMMMMMMMMMTA